MNKLNKGSIMKECKYYKSQFEKALYDELSQHDKEEFEKHLSNCADCSKEYEELKNTLETVRSYKREEPNKEFINDFWKVLSPKLNKQSKFSIWFEEIKSVILFNGKISYQISAALAILIIGVVIGKYWFGGNNIIVNPDNNGNSSSTQIAVQAKADRYIERSKVLLLGIMNFDPEFDDFETISLLIQQKISKGLLSEAASLKDDLKKPRNRQLKELVSDIEIILMQIANLEEQHDIDGIDLIKSGVDKKGIFLKINIQEMKQSSDAITPPITQSNKKENNT